MNDFSKKVYDELEKRLRLIDERDDFVLGVIANAGNAKNWRRVIDFIDKYKENATYETVLAFSVLVDDMTGEDYDG